MQSFMNFAMKKIFVAAFAALSVQTAAALPADSSVVAAPVSAPSAGFQLPEWFPTVNGTIRANYELDTDNGASHFRVRNARVSLSGTVVPEFEYKAEIDLCDEGKIKMLDAYVRYVPVGVPVTATIGQMRVPFTIDAHRGPHQQYFANRSFLAKYGGNVRDVGLAAQYTVKGNVPLTLEGGVFNGSGLTNQKDYWTKTFNFSFKATARFAKVFTLEASCQKSRPEDISIMMWDAGAAYDDGFWHVEAEYLRKNYVRGAFDGVNLFNSFVSRKFPLRRKLTSIAALCRYDFMDSHSDGIKNADGVLTETQPQRHRLTVGSTLAFGAARRVELRVNYEKYFYHKDAVIPVSDHDKLVMEVMCRF